MNEARLEHTFSTQVRVLKGLSAGPLVALLPVSVWYVIMYRTDNGVLLVNGLTSAACLVAGGTIPYFYVWVWTRIITAITRMKPLHSRTKLRQSLLLLGIVVAWAAILQVIVCFVFGAFLFPFVL